MRVHHRIDDGEISGDARHADFNSIELIQVSRALQGRPDLRLIRWCNAPATAGDTRAYEAAEPYQHDCKCRLNLHLFLHRLTRVLLQSGLSRAIVSDNSETTRPLRAWQSQKQLTNCRATGRLLRLATREPPESSTLAHSCAIHFTSTARVVLNVAGGKHC